MKRRAPSRPVLVLTFDDGSVERVDALEFMADAHRQVSKQLGALAKAKDEETERYRADQKRLLELADVSEIVGAIKERRALEAAQAKSARSAGADRTKLATLRHKKMREERDAIGKALAGDRAALEALLASLGCPPDKAHTFKARNVTAFLAKRHRCTVRQAARILG
jgi:hypothetical protein